MSPARQAAPMRTIHSERKSRFLRRRQAERPQLQQVHQRPEEGRHRVGPQDPRRSGGQRRRRICGAVQAGASRHGVSRRPRNIAVSSDGRPGWPPVVLERLFTTEAQRTRRKKRRLNSGFFVSLDEASLNRGVQFFRNVRFAVLNGLARTESRLRDETA